MRSKQEVHKSKSVKEIGTNINYSGERSPYWDFLRKKRFKSENGEITEHVLANPDVLADDENLYGQPLSEDDELRLRVIRETIEQLSPQQKKAVELCGMDGLTLKEAAEQMGVKLATVQVLLKRAGLKIKKNYDREKLLS